MMYENPSRQKRNNFHEHIRRKQINQLFKANRKEKTDPLITELELNSVNERILKRSLVKNQLLSDLRNGSLLLALQQKVQANPSRCNVEFCLSVLSNLLLDDIRLQEKERIFSLGVRWLKQDICALIWVNFCQSILYNGYDYFEEQQQIYIEDTMLPRLIGYLNMRSDNKENLQSEAMTALSYFFKNEPDHNNVLLYKVKRCSNIVSELIVWAGKAFTNVDGYSNELETTKDILMQIMGHISEVPLALSEILSSNTLVLQLIRILIQEIGIQGRYRYHSSRASKQTSISYNYVRSERILASCISTLAITLESERQGGFEVQIAQLFEQRHIESLLGQIQRNDTLVPMPDKLNLMKQILEYTKIYNSPIENLLQSIVSVAVDVLRAEEERTQQQTLKGCLQLILCITLLGYNEGTNACTQFLKKSGGKNILEDIFIKSKNPEITQLIDIIDQYYDICQ